MTLMSLSKPRKKLQEPNLVPLINIVFLLLVFFLVTGTLEHVPQALIDPIITQNADKISLTHQPLAIDAKGQWYALGEPLEVTQIGAYLGSTAHDFDTPLQLYVDQHLPIADLHLALAQLRALGVMHITLLSVE